MMLSRSIRRAALETRVSLPPTFLCPWTASLTTEAHTLTTTTPPPSTLSSTAKTTNPIATVKRSTPKPKLPSPPNLSGPHSKTPPQLSESIISLLPSLHAQSQIYITAHIHAHGFLVTEGDTIRLPFLVKGVEPGDVLRLNRAVNLGSRDFTLRAPAQEARGKSATTSSQLVVDPTPAGAPTSLSHVMPGARPSLSVTEPGADASAPAEHFIPHLAQGRIPYLDERLFVCRAVVMGTEAEPMRILEKTKRRQRHVKHVKSKHKYTVLKIKELRVRTLEEIQSGQLD